MKREILIGLISFTLIWLLALPASGQQDLKTHTVQRGETFSSIAAKYGMSESELRAANPNAKTCFAGMKLNISSRAKTKSDKADNRAQIATTKTTASAVTAPQVQRATVSYPNKFFHKGEEYFFKKKWSKAISSFSKVLSDPSSSEEEKQKSRDYLAKGQKEKEERSQRRREYWSNVADGLKRFGDSLQNTALAMQNSNNQLSMQYNGGLSFSNNYTNNTVQKENPWKLSDEEYDKLVRNGQFKKESFDESGAKTVQSFMRCYICEGKGICPGCHGSGRIIRTRLCPLCSGSGIKMCDACGNIGFLQTTYVYDNSRRLVYYMDHRGIHYLSDGEGSGSSSSNDINDNGKGSKTCKRCHGTGLIPDYSFEQRVTYGSGLFGTPERNDSYCDKCGSKHYAHYRHENCAFCDGVGRTSR